MRDEKKKIEQYRERRVARLKKRGIYTEERLDGVEEYRERRNRRLAERNLRLVPKSLDNSSGKCYNKNGQRRADADDVINGEDVDWITLKKNHKHAAINGKGDIVAGPTAIKGKNMSEVKETAQKNAEKKAQQKAAQAPKSEKKELTPEEIAANKAREEAHRKTASSISDNFLKKRGFKKGTSTFTDSIFQSLEHGMTEEKINQVLDNLKPEDIYEINGEHGVIGLASKIDDELKGKSSVCQDIWNKAKENGTPITNDVLEITKSIGASMSGLEFSVKAGLSTAEKIDREHKDYSEASGGKTDPRTDEEVLGGLNDVVRFTQFSDHDNIAQNALKTMDALKKKGYKIVTCKNRYNLPGQDYYDIKIIAQNKDGQQFELQFHSKESLDVKNTNHKLYEEQRKVDTSEARKKELSKIMSANAATIRKPKDYQKVPQIVNGEIVKG